MTFFTYNGHSSQEFGLHIESKDVFSAPAFDMSMTSIPGRNGDLIVSNRRFSNVKVTYTVFLARKDVASLSDVLRAIKGWLYTEPDRYHEITDSYQPGFLRLGVISEGIEIEEQLNKVGHFTVTFSCKPFLYSLAGREEISFTESGFQIVNPYPFPSKPYFRLEGNGDLSLTIQATGHNDTWQMSGILDYLECDSEQMNFYKGTELQNLKVSGDAFPVLYPGTNTITFTGSVDSITLIPRWCCL